MLVLQMLLVDSSALGRICGVSSRFVDWHAPLKAKSPTRVVVPRYNVYTSFVRTCINMGICPDIRFAFANFTELLARAHKAYGSL
jgi:hypothetical protein